MNKNTNINTNQQNTLNSYANSKNKSRLTLILVFATALAPIVLAVIFYFYYSNHPSMDTKNYGQLIQPMRKTPVNLIFQEQTQTPYQYIDGNWQVVENAPKNTLEKKVELQNFAGKWLMVYHQNAATCDEMCVKHLYALRQLRLSLGKDGGRFVPIWLKGEAQLTPQVQNLYDNAHSNLRLLKIADQETNQKIINWLQVKNDAAQIPSSLPSGLYLIDPQMNYIMHYPRIDEPLKIIKDLRQLLKWSRIG